MSAVLVCIIGVYFASLCVHGFALLFVFVCAVLVHTFCILVVYKARGINLAPWCFLFVREVLIFCITLCARFWFTLWFCLRGFGSHFVHDTRRKARGIHLAPLSFFLFVRFWFTFFAYSP